MKTKKWIILLVLVVLGGIGFFLFLRKTAPPAQTLVPSDTLLFAQIPDGISSYAHYQNSQLRKIFEEKDIQRSLGFLFGFWATHWNSNQELDWDFLTEMGGLLAENMSGDSFLALTYIDPQADEPVGFVLGLRPLQGTNAFQALIEKVKENNQEVLEQNPAQKATYQDTDYDYLKWGKGLAIYHTTVGAWSITTTSRQALEDTIDRALGQSQGVSLIDNKDFHTLQGKLSSSQDALIFANISLALKKAKVLLSTYASESEAFPESAFDTYKPILAALLGTRFTTSGLIQDEWVTLLQPELIKSFYGKTVQPCSYQTLKYTGDNTLLYSAQSYDAEMIWKFLKKNDLDQPEADQLTPKIQKELELFDIDLQKNIFEALGSEIALLSEWPEGSSFPELALLLPLKNAKAFRPVVEALTQIASESTKEENGATIRQGTWTHFKLGDMELQTFKYTRPGISEPTLAFGPDLFALFFTQKGATRILQNQPIYNITKSSDWERLDLNIKGTNQMLFVHMSHLFEKSYGSLAPLLSLASAAFTEEPVSLPPKLDFVSQLGVWGMTTSTQNDTVTTFSASNIGNPILPLFLGLGLTGPLLQENRPAPLPFSPSTEASDENDSSTTFELDIEVP